MCIFAPKSEDFVMIESITIRNFLSFKDEMVFDFSASQEKVKKGFEYIDWFEEVNGKKLLKIQFLFGNNGTGKTNFLSAISTLRKLACKNSRSKSDKEDRLPNCSFKFSASTNNKPSFIKIVFTTDGSRYTYEIEWTAKYILREKLEKKKGKGRQLCVFDRSFNVEKDVTTILFPSKLISTESQKRITDNAINNSSVISIYDSKNFESVEIRNVYSYLLKIKIINTLDEFDLLELFQGHKNDEKFKENLLSLLFDLGSNIVDYQIDTFEAKLEDDEVRIMKSYLGDEEYNKKFPNGTRKIESIRFGHNTDVNEEKAWLNQYEESLGTINMIKLIIALHDGCFYNVPIIIDECSYGIHQLTFGRIIQYYLASSHGSQAIMASQNLSIMEMEGFRRDTIKIFDKDRETGITSCLKVNLRKYHKNISIVKAYLDNSFGSLPLFPTKEKWQENLSKYRMNNVKAENIEN